MRIRSVVLMFLLAGLVISIAPTMAQDDADALIVTTLSDFQTLDPAIGYDTVNWPLIALLYRGLMTYNEDQTELVPGLAESYEVTDDGLTYTFVLRDGIIFSNGREITTEDVKYTIERILDPATASPGSFMFVMIVGADAFMAGDADEVSGIRIIDDKTIEFELTYPEWTFLNRLALNFGGLVAREGVEAAGDDFGREPLGAGPYILESWEPGLEAVFARNPNYYQSGLPKIDRIVVQIGIDPSASILRIETGEADTSLDWLPASDYPRVIADESLADNLVPLTAFPHVAYITLDWSEEPFNVPEVRQALNIAIDRERISTILNNRAILPNGPLNPNVPGENADLEHYEYNPEHAQELLAEAGLGDGFSVTFHTTTDPTQVAIAQAIQQDWDAIGVTTELVTLDVAPLLDLAYSTPEEFQALYVEWYLDYVDPSNLYQPLLQCGSSTNWGLHCNEEMDAQEQAASILPPGDERWAAYAELEAAMREELSFLPLYHLPQFYYISDRVASLASHPSYVIDFERAELAP